MHSVKFPLFRRAAGLTNITLPGRKVFFPQGLFYQRAVFISHCFVRIARFRETFKSENYTLPMIVKVAYLIFEW